MSNSDEIKQLFDTHVMPTYAPGLALARGRGTKVWDADGKVYLDFAAGISVLNVGHSHPVVVAAIREQAGVLMHVSNLYYTEQQARLAEILAGLGLGGKCFFGNSGAEANEALIKLARLWGHDSGRQVIITMDGSFHGRTLATVAATGQAKVKKGFDPLPTGFCHADYNDLDSVASKVNERTVAVLLEAVQGEGGVIPADADFFVGVRKLCDEKDLLMLCDEVQCGMGRTGHWFGYEAYGVAPDAFSLAKALGSGYPIGAVVSGEKLADVFSPGTHASTFGGTPLACAAALATLGVIEQEGLIAKARETGEVFQRGLQSLVEKYEHAVAVRGRGLMLGLVLDQAAKPLTDILTEMGLLALATAETVVRFLPPLNVKPAEVEEALEILDEALAEWHEQAVAGDDAETPGPAENPAEPVTEPEAAPEPEVEAEPEVAVEAEVEVSGEDEAAQADASDSDVEEEEKRDA